MYLQFISLLGLNQETTVPQWAFQFIMLHTAQNKKTYYNLPLLLSYNVILRALWSDCSWQFLMFDLTTEHQPLVDICWQSQELYTFHPAAVLQGQPSIALYLKTAWKWSLINTLTSCLVVGRKHINSLVKCFVCETELENLLLYNLLLTCRKQTIKTKLVKTSSSLEFTSYSFNWSVHPLTVSVMHWIFELLMCTHLQSCNIDTWTTALTPGPPGQKWWLVPKARHRGPARVWCQQAAPRQPE